MKTGKVTVGENLHGRTLTLEARHAILGVVQAFHQERERNPWTIRIAKFEETGTTLESAMSEVSQVLAHAFEHAYLRAEVPMKGASRLPSVSFWPNREDSARWSAHASRRVVAFGPTQKWALAFLFHDILGHLLQGPFLPDDFYSMLMGGDP